MKKHGGLLKTLGGFKTAMIETLFRSRVVRRRMADSHLGIILSDFALFLEARGHVLTSLQAYVQVSEHFSRWLGEHGLPVHEIGETLVEQFVRGHLTHCRCPKPHPIHPRNCRSALGLLLAFLRQTKRIKPPARTPDSAINRLVRGYDAYLNDVAGLAFETRFYRRRYAREFLQSRLRRGRIQLTGLSPKILRRYIQRRATVGADSSQNQAAPGTCAASGCATGPSSGGLSATRATAHQFTLPVYSTSSAVGPAAASSPCAWRNPEGAEAVQNQARPSAFAPAYICHTASPQGRWTQSHC